MINKCCSMISSQERGLPLSIVQINIQAFSTATKYLDKLKVSKYICIKTCFLHYTLYTFVYKDKIFMGLQTTYPNQTAKTLLLLSWVSAPPSQTLQPFLIFFKNMQLPLTINLTKKCYILSVKKIAFVSTNVLTLQNVKI